MATGDIDRSLPAATRLEWHGTRHLHGTPVDAGPAPADRTACIAGLPGFAMAAAAIHTGVVQRPHPGIDLDVVTGNDAACVAGRRHADNGRLVVAPPLAGSSAGDPVLLRRSIVGVQHGGTGAVLRTSQLPSGNADVLAAGTVVVQCAYPPGYNAG